MRDRDDWDDARGAEIYAEVVHAGRLYRQLAGRLLDAVCPAPGAALLDLATGSGVVLSAALARTGPPGRLVGVDRAYAMLAVAAANLPVESVGIVTADTAALPFSERSFDAVTCSAALWHFPAITRTLEEVARVLAPGGRAAFNVPCAQLDDVADGDPPALFRSLASAGQRRFGSAPAPGGPLIARRWLLDSLREAGLTPDHDESFDVTVRQSELAELLGAPALIARLYPRATYRELDAFVEEACRDVDLDAEAMIRWWQVSAVRR